MSAPPSMSPIATTDIRKDAEAAVPGNQNDLHLGGQLASNGMSAGDSGPDIAQINVDLYDYVKGNRTPPTRSSPGSMNALNRFPA